MYSCRYVFECAGNLAAGRTYSLHGLWLRLIGEERSASQVVVWKILLIDSNESINH